MNHNEIAREHHMVIVDMGYWNNPTHMGVLLMLVVTEVSKLFDEAKLNKPEKLADVALRLYDMSCYHNVDLSELPTVEECDIWNMINCLTCEMEAYRVHIKTEGRYIKQCLSMCYLYANLNGICLINEIKRKQNMIKLMSKKRV